MLHLPPVIELEGDNYTKLFIYNGLRQMRLCKAPASAARPYGLT